MVAAICSATPTSALVTTSKVMGSTRIQLSSQFDHWVIMSGDVRCDHGAIVIIRFPTSSTAARWPGWITVVVSICSTTAGPAN